MSKKNDLIDAVPVRLFRGRPFYIRIQDIPEPWGAQFEKAIIGSAQPRFEGEGPCAHAIDWERWLNGNWYAGHNGPEGLEPAT